MPRLIRSLRPCTETPSNAAMVDAWRARARPVTGRWVQEEPKYLTLLRMLVPPSRSDTTTRRTYSRNFDNRLNFDGEIEGQRTHSDGAASVPPTVAENLDKKV